MSSKDSWKTKGVEHGASEAYFPQQQNGSAECLQGSLEGMVQQLLLPTGLPEPCGAEARHTAAHSHNRIPSTATSFELWFERKPGLKHPKAFGPKAYAPLPKLDPGLKRESLLDMRQGEKDTAL